jgi:putative aminopeptidase FrvX
MPAMPAVLTEDQIGAVVNETVPMLVALLDTPSPTGYTREAIALLREAFGALGIPGLAMRETKKGALVLTLKGRSGDAPRGLTAHVDTLGAMIKEIKPNGRLKLTMLGGSPWPAIENEGVTIRTADDAHFRGQVVPVNGSTHVNKDTATMARSADTLEVRIDARTTSAAETRALGIAVGDFVFFDPRVELSDAGFIRSRHLDDKLCVAAIYGALLALRDTGGLSALAQDTHIVIASYEEVGHGGASDWPAELDEMLVVDMAAIGIGQESDEYSVTLCVKDGSGPYSFAMNDRLRALARDAGIALKTDIYPFYSSDGSAYWRAGGAAQVALVGPGVDNSHGCERSHLDALGDTIHLLAAYLVT